MDVEYFTFFQDESDLTDVVLPFVTVMVDGFVGATVGAGVFVGCDATVGCGAFVGAGGVILEENRLW